MIFHKTKFRELRESRGLTLKDVADACGVSPKTVQKWEKHSTLQPLPERIRKLAEVLQCSEHELVKKTPQNSGSRKAEIIRDLAERIEQQATEHFATRAEEIRESLMRPLRTAYPNSADESLSKIGVLILTRRRIDDNAIMAEVRELNSTLVKSERTLKTYPGETEK